MMTHGALLVAVVIWGSTFVATKICLEQMGTLQLVASRFVLGAPALYLIARARRARLDLRPVWRPVCFGAAVFSVHFILQTWALEFTSATKTGWIVAVTPVTLAILARIFLKEAMTRAVVSGIVLASAGIVALVSRGSLSSLSGPQSFGDWLALLSTLTWAIYTIVTRDLSRARDPVVIAFAMTLPLAVGGLVLPALLSTWVSVGDLSGKTLWALSFLGLGGVAIAQWFWQHGVARLGATTAGLFLYLEPLVTTALAVPLLGEPFGPTTALGGSLILGGVFVASRGKPTTSS